MKNNWKTATIILTILFIAVIALQQMKIQKLRGSEALTSADLTGRALTPEEQAQLDAQIEAYFAAHPELGNESDREQMKTEMKASAPKNYPKEENELAAQAGGGDGQWLFLPDSTGRCFWWKLGSGGWSLSGILNGCPPWRVMRKSGGALEFN